MYLYSSTNLPPIFKPILSLIFQLCKPFYRQDVVPIVTICKLFAQSKLVLPIKMTSVISQIWNQNLNYSISQIVESIFSAINIWKLLSCSLFPFKKVYWKFILGIIFCNIVTWINLYFYVLFFKQFICNGSDSSNNHRKNINKAFLVFIFTLIIISMS